MIFQLQDLDNRTDSLLPENCRCCGWWQGYDNGWPDPGRAEEWAKGAREIFGRWGKLAIGDGVLLGMIQMGPAELFERSSKLDSGPVSGDAVLLSCSEVADGAPPSIRKSLLTALLFELEREGVEKVEAFSIDTGEADCRFFSSEFLRDCGFYPVRSRRGLRLMRLELRATLPVAPRRKRRRIMERIKRTAAAPAPVTLCHSKANTCAAGARFIADDG